MSPDLSIVDRIFRFRRPPDDPVEPVPGQRIRLSGRGIRVPLTDHPVEITLGKESLYLQSDTGLGGSVGSAPPGLILFNPARKLNGIGHVLPIAPGDRLRIRRDDPAHMHLFDHPREAFRRRFQVDHDGDTLVFRDPISELGTYLTIHPESVADSDFVQQRRRALSRLAEILDGAARLLPTDRAVELVRRVNEVLRNESYRQSGTAGTPGGLLDLPVELTPVIVGDLHGNVDNLLTLLCEGTLLRSLHDQTVALVFLGDLVHPDREPLDRMDDSVLIMDLLLQLKLRFPSGVFILRGNHETFAPDLAKGGVPQGLLWRRQLTELRGEPYTDLLSSFYDSLPVLARSREFVACHAGPPRRSFALDEIVDVHANPGLMRELIWNRVRGRNHPQGYTARDVRRFRKTLGLDPDTPFMVGHYPYAESGTVWINVGAIEGHHIVYSARAEVIGCFTRIDGVMVPQVRTSDPSIRSALS